MPDFEVTTVPLSLQCLPLLPPSNGPMNGNNMVYCISIKFDLRRRFISAFNHDFASLPFGDGSRIFTIMGGIEAISSVTEVHNIGWILVGLQEVSYTYPGRAFSMRSASGIHFLLICWSIITGALPGLSQAQTSPDKDASKPKKRSGKGGRMPLPGGHDARLTPRVGL